MASAAANHVRSSIGPQGQTLHLGSFSRIDIADFDSKGRYPTTPSPQETRMIAANHARQTSTTYQQDDRRGDSDINPNINAQSTSADVVANYDAVRASAQNTHRQDSRVSGDNSPIPKQVPALSAPILDPAEASLPPGPRHPQAPSHAATLSQTSAGPLQQQQKQPSQHVRTGSKGPAPYPYSPATTPTQIPPSQSQTQTYIPPNLKYSPAMLQVQNSPRPQQPPPPEEVCIECMMRDRDMADVIVVGPGIWDRESDVHLRELIEREDEEERAWRERHAAELAVPGNRLRPPRRASKGHRLTEQNLKIWLQLNPKEAHARIITIDSYVKQQRKLLAEEAEARAKSQQEAQRVDAIVQDTVNQIRHSAYDVRTAGVPNDDIAAGIRVQTPRSSMYEGGRKEDNKPQRDITLLDNGLIMERVDLKREEKERKKEQKKARNTSQVTDTSSIAPGGYAPPITPTPSGLELESNGDYEALNPNMSSPSLQPPRPKSAHVGVPVTKYSSHTSVDAKGPRFLGSKHWQAPWNSGASVAPSGSMMDMHVALEQEHDHDLQQFGIPGPMDQRYTTSSFSLPASPQNRSRPHTADALMAPHRSTSPHPKRTKKATGLGKLWKMVKNKKSDGSKHQDPSIASSLPQEDDMSMPLPPPPKMPYLNQYPRSPSLHSRQLSTPGAAQNGTLSQATHPRTVSQPGTGSSSAISPATAPSSILSSPKSNLPSWRESGDGGRQSTAKEPNMDGTEATQGILPSDANPIQLPQQYGNETNPMHVVVTGGSASSEYGRMHQQPSNTMSIAGTRSPAPSTMISSSVHSPRPLSSVHKPLPPPPPSEGSVMRPMSAVPLAPAGAYGARPTTIAVSEDTFTPPAPFREDGYEARRQSFSGSISRVDVLPPGAGPVLQTKRSVPGMAYMGRSEYQGLGTSYDAYPASPYLNGAMSDGGKTKRRSRFLPFLGKKEKDKTPAPNFAPQLQPNGEMRYSAIHASPSPPLMAPTRLPFGHSQRSRSSASLSAPDFAPGMNGGMNGTSHHPSQQPFGFTEGGRPMSGASTFTTGTRINKQMIDEVVPRDSDFLAYRYPSADQPLDVSRL